MRWNFKAVPTVKTIAATLSMWTMCIAPVAQGAEAARNKQLINQYLKESGLTTKKMTIGEFWGKVRHIYPTALQKQLDPWMAIHKNELMPKIEASSFKDSDNNEQVRLLLTSGSETGTLTFTGDDDKPMKVNGVTLTKADLDYNKFEQLAAKVAKEDPVLSKSLNQGAQTSVKKSTPVTVKRFLKGQEIAKLPLRQQMDYLLKMRTASEAADRVLETQQKKSSKGASFDLESPESAVTALWKVLLGTEAVAKNEKDNSCIASGWVASYYNGSCARPTKGQESLLQQIDNLRTSNTFSSEVVSKIEGCATGGGLPCNPLLYGFQPSGTGEPICIRSDLKSATKQCSSQVPLPDKKEQIIQSIAKARGGQDGLCKVTDKDGVAQVSKACYEKLDKYTKQLEEHYLNAAKFCTKGGVTDVDSAREWEKKARTDIRGDQKEACDNLKDRFFDLKVEAAAPAVPPTPCAARVPGSHEGENGECVCSDGKPPHAPQPTAAAKGKGKAKSSSDLPPPPSVKGGSAGGDLPAPPAPGEGSDSGNGQLTCEPVAVQPPAEGEVTDTKLPGGKEVPKDACGFLCKYKGILIAVGVGLVGLGLFWWLTKKKTKTSSPVYIPPAAPPLATATATATATTTISPVPTNPCPSPNTVINGVCTAPVFTPPPTPPSPTTEGGSGTGPTAGAVR